MAHLKEADNTMGVAVTGPVPKRTDERLGHSHGARDADVDKPPAGEVVTVPPENPLWHYVSKTLYRSLAESGMSRYYESTDWAAAYLICDQINKMYQQVYVGMQVVGPAGRQEARFEFMPINPAGVNTLLAALGKLGMTEGDRRRMRIELQRGPVVEETSEGETAEAEMRATLGIPSIAGGQRVG